MSIKRKAAATSGLFVIATGFTACGQSESPASEKLKVVATTTVVGDLVKAIAGDTVDIHQIQRPNTDPHEFEPRAEDSVKVSQADLVISSGLGIDSWITRLQKGSGSKAPLFDLSDGLPHLLQASKDDEHSSHGSETEGHHEEASANSDPHWWHDPTNTVAAVGKLQKALSPRLSKTEQTKLEKSSSDFISKINEVDSLIASCIKRIPTSDRRIATAHQSFSYFADRYKLQIVGSVVSSVSTLAQASAGDVSKLTKVLKDQKVKAIFPENSFNPKVLEALSKQSGTAVGEQLFGDGLGSSETGADTYLGMMKHNAQAVSTALNDTNGACELP